MVGFRARGWNIVLAPKIPPATHTGALSISAITCTGRDTTAQTARERVERDKDFIWYATIWTLTYPVIVISQNKGSLFSLFVLIYDARFSLPPNFNIYPLSLRFQKSTIWYVSQRVCLFSKRGKNVSTIPPSTFVPSGCNTFTFATATRFKLFDCQTRKSKN